MQQHGFSYLVNQKPIRADVAFSMARIVINQGVIAVALGQLLPIGEFVDDIGQFLQVPA